MAALAYAVRFPGKAWESISDICGGNGVSVVGNLCSNGFKSVADTASFTLRYVGTKHYVEVANGIISAQSSNGKVGFRVSKAGDGGEILFEGHLDLTKLSIRSTKIPTELSLSAKDYTQELDAVPNVNEVYDGKTVMQIVDSLLSKASDAPLRKLVSSWPSDSLSISVPDVPMVLTTEDKTTFRQRIDVLLQEMGGYVLNLDPADGKYKVRKIIDSSTVDSKDAVSYKVTDALVSERGLWDNDGIVVKYPTVERATEKRLVYTYMPSLKDAEDGVHVDGEEIDVNAFWPKDGDLTPTFQNFETSYSDSAYNSGEHRQQNSDLDLYYVDPGTGSTPDIDISYVVCDSSYNKVNDWYDTPAVPSIYKEAGVQIYPRKAWLLLKNVSGKKLNITHLEIKGRPVYRTRVNHLVAPKDCEKPYEYEASYVCSEQRITALAKFLYNLKANSHSVSRWTDRWEAHELGQKVKVQHKGWKDNAMGWMICVVAAKSLKVIGGELWAEYTAVAVGGWTELPQIERHTDMTSTNQIDAYSQWLAEGNVGTKSEWLDSLRNQFDFAWSSSPDAIDDDVTVYTWDGLNILINGVPIGDMDMDVWSQLVSVAPEGKPYLWVRINGGAEFRLTGTSAKVFRIKRVNPSSLVRNTNLMGYQLLSLEADIQNWDNPNPVWLVDGKTYAGTSVQVNVPYSVIRDLDVDLYNGDDRMDTVVVPVTDVTDQPLYDGAISDSSALSSFSDGRTHAILWIGETGNYIVMGVNLTLTKNVPYWFDGVEWHRYEGIDSSNASMMFSMLKDADGSYISDDGVYAWFKNLVAQSAVINQLFSNAITLLDGGYIQSEDYMPNERGFKIEASGQSEFVGTILQKAKITDCEVGGGEAQIICPTFESRKSKDFTPTTLVVSNPTSTKNSNRWYALANRLGALATESYYPCSFSVDPLVKYLVRRYTLSTRTAVVAPYTQNPMPQVKTNTTETLSFSFYDEGRNELYSARNTVNNTWQNGNSYTPDPYVETSYSYSFTGMPTGGTITVNVSVAGDVFIFKNIPYDLGSCTEVGQVYIDGGTLKVKL